MGSISFVLFYLILLIFPKRIQFKILSSLPLINKILHFYRKLILINTENKKMKDFTIIGSGAGGSSAALELLENGYSVEVFEEGV